MPPGADHLFKLLPAVIREADAGRSHPLRDLLRVIGEEALLVDEDIRRMYDNLFIETCEPWAAPYLGDLVGYITRTTPQGDVTCNADALPDARRAIASRVGLARRKGTSGVFDDLIAQTTGWAARVQEDAGGPFTVGIQVWRLPSWPLTRVRPFEQPRGVNCFSFSTLGNDAPLFTRADPEPDGEEMTSNRMPPRRLTRRMLRTELTRHYGPERSLCIYENGQPVAARRLRVRRLRGWSANLARDEVAVDPVRGRFMFPERHRPTRVSVSYHYGLGAAMGGGEYRRELKDATAGMSLFRAGHLEKRGVVFLETLRRSPRRFSEWLRTAFKPDVLSMPLDDPAEVERRLTAELNRLLQALVVPDELIHSFKLDDEAAALLAIDPRGARRIRLNRLILEAAYPDAVRRSFAKTQVVARGGHRVIADAVRAMQESAHPPMTMVVELTDSGLYVEPVVVHLPALRTLILRAAEGCRPTIVLPERQADVDDLVISCGQGSHVVLDGLMVARRAVRIVGNPHDVRIRHCTFVPGWDLDERCQPKWGTEAGLVLSDIPLLRPGDDDEGRAREEDVWDDCPPELLAATRVCIDRSIVGSLIVQRDEVDAEPLRLEIRHSIVDATSRTRHAISAPGGRWAHAVISVSQSTVLGSVRTHAIQLAEDSIFTGSVDSARRQVGCMRYCYVPRLSHTPTRYACQPDLAIAAAKATGGDPNAAEARVIPSFVSRRYGRPDYCWLGNDCPPEISRGAEDESEMGVFGELHLSQRLESLYRAIEDFLPLGWAPDLKLES